MDSTRTRLWLLGLAGLGVACGGSGTENSRLSGIPVSLSKESGDGQLGATGQPLPAPYTVTVRDSAGTPVSGAVVHWRVVAGGGSVLPSGIASNSSGSAAATGVLGPALGADSVMAWLNGVPDTVRFGARAALSLLATVPIPENYGIHDTYVRDGIAFVFAWNTGVMIFDVGNGIAGGTPAAPVLVSTTPVGGGEVHNGWWFHPPGGPARYLFTGQEGPGTIGASSGGDIHVLDVTDLAHPQEAAFFHMPGAGTHNFWMDEAAGILYAAYYNGGVIALNVSGVLSGDLSIQNRLLANTLPGGVGGTYVWGVQLYNGSLYASDMLSGFWRLSATDLSVVSGGNNVPDRYSSDLWVANGFAFTGTWGARAGHPGNALKVWQLGQGSDPAALVDSVVTLGIGTVSDVEVSPNGALLVFSAENGPNAGVHFYGLADPAHPSFLARYLVASGIHTASMATVGGRLYLFAARDPSGAALMIFDITDLAA